MVGSGLGRTSAGEEDWLAKELLNGAQGAFFIACIQQRWFFFSLDLHLKTNLIYTWLKISCIFILLSTWQQNATVFKVAKTWSFGNGPLRSDFAFCHLTRQIFGEGMLVGWIFPLFSVNLGSLLALNTLKQSPRLVPRLLLRREAVIHPSTALLWAGEGLSCLLSPLV